MALIYRSSTGEANVTMFHVKHDHRCRLTTKMVVFHVKHRASFADAETRKHDVKDVFRIDTAGHPPQGPSGQP